jgi:hypothetical protein
MTLHPDDLKRLYIMGGDGNRVSMYDCAPSEFLEWVNRVRKALGMPMLKASQGGWGNLWFRAGVCTRIIDSGFKLTFDDEEIKNDEIPEA